MTCPGSVTPCGCCTRPSDYARRLPERSGCSPRTWPSTATGWKPAPWRWSVSTLCTKTLNCGITRRHLTRIGSCRSDRKAEEVGSTCLSAADLGHASATISRCWKPPSRWRRSSAVPGSNRSRATSPWPPRSPSSRPSRSMRVFTHGDPAREDQEQLHFSGVPRRLLNQLHARGQTEFGVDVGEVRLHGARRNEKPCGDVVVAQSFAEEAHYVQLGRRE